MVNITLVLQRQIFRAAVLEVAIRENRDRVSLSVDNEEWELLFQVVRAQQVRGDAAYQTLIRSLFVFEYCDSKGKWFGINPLLAETENFKAWQQQNS